MDYTCPLCGIGWFKHRHNLPKEPDCPNYRKLSGSRNQCTECGGYFNSNSAFDFHRKNFTCLSIPEMQAKGMVQVADSKGQLWWVEKPSGTRSGSTDHSRRSGAPDQQATPHA